MPETLLEALETIARQQAMIDSLTRHVAWAEGRRGDGGVSVPGLTDTMTRLLRRFAACGVVTHAEFDDLHRHVSHLRKRLKSMAPTVSIVTLKRIGYQMNAGFQDVYRLLRAGVAPCLTVGDFTPAQTAILKTLAHRGAIHVEAGKAIGRHISNIRVKLKAAKILAFIQTNSGEGLYTVSDRSRSVLRRFIDGELIECAPHSMKGVAARAA